ncbi:MAG: DUF1877 family protein [Pirellulaceae bacterium]|nr:DUF1877 family protein [Pirellulaceae bacterium]
MVVSRGYHIALSREHAKRLFGQKDDENLRKFLDDLIADPGMKKSGRLFDSGIQWDAMHRCLTEGELDSSAGEFPLNHVVLGGKQLHQGGDYVAALVRPDMTNFVADAIADVEEENLRKSFFGLPASFTAPRDEKAFMAVWLSLQNLKDFYDAAAENLEAVVFTAKYAS